jgi:hypothetical protein
VGTSEHAEEKIDFFVWVGRPHGEVVAGFVDEVWG